MNHHILPWLAGTLMLVLTVGAGAAPWPPQSFTAYYGKFDEATPQQLADFELLIVHPGEHGDNLDNARVAKLHATGKPKTVVGYISIGEESLSPGGPPLEGQDGSGPSFVGKDLKPGMAANGYPSYFLDQRKILFGPDGFPQLGLNGQTMIEKGQDGLPDENGVWGSYYVKADDPLWQSKVFERLDRLDKLGLDGFFLDTVDTASPWGDYGWTSSAMLGLVEKIRARYPDKRIIANRGLFYLGQNDRFASTIDAVLFESMLTAYSDETKSASISPWARWHVQALEDDVIPAQRRTGLALLVLDYLEPSHSEAPLLIQSARTLLQNTTACLTYSHPRLDIPGWTANQLLDASVPADWPTITGIEVKEEKLGALVFEVTFDGPIPAEAIPDLRLTTRTDLAPRLAAELPLTWVMSYHRDGSKATVSADGLDKGTAYQLFFRLISKSRAVQSPFGWTTLTTAPSDLPGQVTDLSADSNAQGLVLAFNSKTPAKQYRIYTYDANGKKALLQETASSPVTLEQLAVGSASELMVTAVDALDREGYPSLPYLAVRRGVTPLAPPGAIAISSDAQATTFFWQAVPEVKSYRFFAVPEGQDYRLPLVTKDSKLVVKHPRKGNYRVFATTVDKYGNQSRPGPSVVWKVK